MKLRDYILRRLLLLIPVLIGISFITFMLTHNIPNYDPASPWLKQKFTHDEREQVIKQHHLDQPVVIQYITYLSDLSHFDLGLSTSEGSRPVADALWDYLPATIELTLFSMLICIVVGIPMGVLSAIKKDKIPDHVIRIFSLAGISIPVFWFALILQYVFYAQFKILPLGGRLPTGIVPPTFNLPFVIIHSTGIYSIDSLLAGNFDLFVQVILHLIMPSFCLAFIQLAVIARMTRSSMLEAMTQDFIRTARSKGLSERVVIFKHALRNALIPTTTIIGLLFGSLLSGAVLTETIFYWPGVGRYSTEAIRALDYPALMGFTMIIVIVYVVTNLVVDIMYAYLDPRIKYG
ncbi:MAG TPA: ABC transporter permease [Methanocella sp.]|nr:ABC transporter permease [Methanocella sp.]